MSPISLVPSRPLQADVTTGQSGRFSPRERVTGSSLPEVGRDQDPFPPLAAGPFAIGEVPAPWGPIHVAATRHGVVGLAVLAPREAFRADVARRTGRDVAAGSQPMLERARVALALFLDGEPAELEALPLDLADRGSWDRAVLGAVRDVRWGSVTSYGRLARMIGRPGAARAAGGAVGRNPIGLAIPCHRVIAGDGSIGGYGGDWFGSRDDLLAVKRELLAIEGIPLPARHLLG